MTHQIIPRQSSTAVVAHVRLPATHKKVRLWPYIMGTPSSPLYDESPVNLSSTDSAGVADASSCRISRRYLWCYCGVYTTTFSMMVYILLFVWGRRFESMPTTTFFELIPTTKKPARGLVKKRRGVRPDTQQSSIISFFCRLHHIVHFSSSTAYR